MPHQNLLLLVDENFLVRCWLTQELSNAGFAVRPAMHGEQAITELDSGVDRFRALITSIRLGPGPDGWDVGRRARQLHASMPVIYMSGAPNPDWKSQGVSNSVLVAKPLQMSKLIGTVSRLVSGVEAGATAMTGSLRS